MQIIEGEKLRRFEVGRILNSEVEMRKMEKQKMRRWEVENVRAGFSDKAIIISTWFAAI